MLEVTIDGGRYIGGPAQAFCYYKDPEILQIVPDSGPMCGGTKVQIIGSNLNYTCHFNKTARFAVYETKPNITQVNDTVMWVTSPAVKVPDATVVAVA